MKQSKIIAEACDLLIARVRFETAVLSFDRGVGFRKDNTQEIRDATRLYVETWVVPLLELIRDGKIAELRERL